MQNPPEGAHVALFLVNQTSSRALGNMTDGVPPFRLQPEKVQAARLRIHRLEEGPHRSKHGGSPPEKLPEPQGAVDCASRGPEACNWAKPPRHWFVRMKFQPTEAQGSGFPLAEATDAAPCLQ